MCNAALGVLVHTIQLIHHVDMLIVSDYTRFEQFYILTDAALPVDDRKKAALEALAAENMKVVEEVNLIYASLQPYLVNTDGDRYDVKFHMAAMLTQTMEVEQDKKLGFYDNFQEWVTTVMDDLITPIDHIGTYDYFTNANQGLTNVEQYMAITSTVEYTYGLTGYGSTNVTFDGTYHINVLLSGEGVDLGRASGPRNGLSFGRRNQHVEYGGMCDWHVPHRTVLVDSSHEWWDTSRTLAHELGHTFSIPHDNRGGALMYISHTNNKPYQLERFQRQDQCQSDGICVTDSMYSACDGYDTCKEDSMYLINAHFSSGNAVCLRTTSVE